MKIEKQEADFLKTIVESHIESLEGIGIEENSYYMQSLRIILKKLTYLASYKK